MKRVALFVHNLTVEYSLSVAQGVASFFTSDKDVKLILAQTNQPNYPHGLYEYQYWTSAELLKAEDIDLIIIVTSAYQTFTPPEELEAFLKPFSKKPIVSIAADLPFDDVHYTTSDCTQAYNQVIEHLVKEHGCKNIGFLSAAETNSAEGIARLAAFKKALENNNLIFNPDNVIEAMFIREAAYTITREKYKSKEDVKVDAFLAANDLMAEGCMKALQELGVKVPKDVKFVGFDDSVRASFTSPSLSTIDQNVAGQGYKAAEIAWKILNGEKLPRETKTTTEPIYRQSCGCVKSSNISFVSRNQAGEIVENHHINSNTIEEYTESSKDINGIYTLIDIFHKNHTLEDFFNSLTAIAGQLKFASMSVVLYEEPVYFKKSDKIEIPDKAYLKVYIEGDRQIIPYDEKGIETNPHKNLIPPAFHSVTTGTYIVHPIFAGEKQYGYLMVKPTDSKFQMHHVYLKLIINAIANAWEYTQALNKNEALTSRNERLLRNNQELNFQNSIDELTQVLNRRGFMEKAEKELKRAVKNGLSGMVFFADMDGLKKINDTYGHKVGDLAIQTEARVLSAAFRNSDIVGRLSGDEFAILSTGLTKGYISAIRTRIEQLNLLLSQEAGLPVTLSLSLGHVAFTPEKSNLDALLSRADEKLYEEKEIKHASKQ
ncbi:GGDEF domain-containing protein [Treponema bryantii]|uniref:substrate-binding and GGDEF domain-containing protein n=1 Tax=Treponema bryantii TaxID=163 RepID=UPI0003B3D3A5|nr:GGDEF domain-containing protein [Treponema bryantii]